MMAAGHGGILHPAMLRDSLPTVSTITAILEPDADGTLHLPLPVELRRGKVRVTATVQAASEAPGRARSGLWTGRQGFWMSPDFDEPLDEFRDYME